MIANQTEMWKKFMSGLDNSERYEMYGFLRQVRLSVEKGNADMVLMAESIPEKLLSWAEGSGVNWIELICDVASDLDDRQDNANRFLELRNIRPANTC